MDPEQTNPPEDAVEGFLDGVAERVTDGMGTRHFPQLLPEEYPMEPDPPDVWKDEEAMNEWIDQLPDRDVVTVIQVINTPPEDQQFKNETRPLNS